ncbi:amidase [Sphingobium sp. SJ10-10]|uniref:amidase n=1 Tax=Sphingobium sp. SJ10-10 TaxID=3114999 RepID=UPI002E17D26A|nr:amidase [Sphingobium sp. SJ10-10]
MIRNDLHYADLATIGGMLRRRKISAVELMAHMLERIGRLDPRLHGFAFLDADGAMEKARVADSLLARGAGGALTGIPIAVKDLFWTSDMPTAAGMTIHRDFRPTEDATVVRRLREAGAVIFGKLQMTEGAFAMHHPAVEPPVNPWGEALWTGASSSGSGVAVAAGLSFASLGSDTGGSIRFPGVANGLTGLKPSWGRVSRHGAFELAASLDHVGPMARSAWDVALLYAIIAGHDPADPTSWPGRPDPLDGEAAIDLGGVRIGHAPLALAGCDAELGTAIGEAVSVFAGLGGSVREVALPDMLSGAAQWELLAGVEAALAHAATYPARADDYGVALSRLIGLGRDASAMDYQKPRLIRMDLRGRLDALLADVDMLILPVLPYAAPTLDRLGALAEDPDANTRLISFTAPFNLGGQPALCLPCRPTSAGAPLGFQLVAARGREDVLLRAAMAFQRETDWHLRHPID